MRSWSTLLVSVGLRRSLALMALVGQLVGGATMLPHAAVATSSFGIPVVICHAGGETDQQPAPETPAGPHSGHDCALCPGCLGSAPPPLALSEPPAIPPPSPRPAATYAPKPNATAPPINAARGVPPPTGPPLRA